MIPTVSVLEVSRERRVTAESEADWMETESISIDTVINTFDFWTVVGSDVERRNYTW